jgi:hypothetical protein
VSLLPCVPSPLARRDFWGSVVQSTNSRGTRTQKRRPSPSCGRVGSRIMLFEACSAFTHVTACRFAESLNDPDTAKAPTCSSPPTPLRLLPAGTTSCRVGTHTPRKKHPLAQHTAERAIGFIRRKLLASMPLPLFRLSTCAKVRRCARRNCIPGWAVDSSPTRNMSGPPPPCPLLPILAQCAHPERS